jgi:hypothetical protein
MVKFQVSGKKREPFGDEKRYKISVVLRELGFRIDREITWIRKSLSLINGGELDSTG